MIRHIDLTLGERLALGFGALLLGLGAFTAAVLYWGDQSARAQRAYLENIEPLRERAQALEGKLLYVAIGMRDFVLYPEEASRAELTGRIEAVRSALGQLEALPKPPEGMAFQVRMSARVGSYLQGATELLEQGRTDEARLALARELGKLREVALSDVRGYVAVLQKDSDAAVATMAAARERVAIGSLAMVTLAALFAVAAAWLTARSVRRPLRELTQVAASLGQGDWLAALRLAARELPAQGEAIAVRSETRTLARAVAAAAVQLEGRERQLRARAAVSASISSTVDKAALAGRALQPIVEHVQAEVGVLYWRPAHSPLLQPIATHALGDLLPSLQEGEGLPGEAARARRTIVLRDVPRDSAFSVRIGYDQAPPRAIAAVPILFQETLHGVLLVAGLRDFDAAAIAFLETVARELGIGLQNVASYEHAQQLLAELTERNQEIQTQNEEIQAQNEELQAQSEELRQQGEALRSQADALAEADERKNQFLAVLAHELRNPMAPITTNLEILRRVPADGEQGRRAQAVIHRQARQLVRLIDDLLDITRISQGKVRLEREPMDLVQVAHACIEDQASTLADRSLGFEADLPAGPLWVHGDRARLSQVVGNLVTNAVKFTDPGGRIRLRAHADHATGHAVLQVVDTGIGMEAQLIPRLFQPFSQGPAGLARRNAGLGLGLALVKSLVSLHEGTVEARSDGPGRGSEFTVRLPLGAQQGPAPAAARAAAVPHAAATQQWRVLVVDDYVDAAMGLRALIRLDGHAVEIATDGAEAIDKARAFRPQLVLCDIALPTMDGFEVARRLRAEDCGRSTLLVALTGYGSEADVARCKAAGFDHHFVKPLDPARLNELFGELARRPA